MLFVADVEDVVACFAFDEETEEEGDIAIWSTESTVRRVHRYLDKWVTVALDVVLMNLLRAVVNSLSGCGLRMTSISSMESVCMDEDCSVLALDSASDSISEFCFNREFLPLYLLWPFW